GFYDWQVADNISSYLFPLNCFFNSKRRSHIPFLSMTCLFLDYMPCSGGIVYTLVLTFFKFYQYCFILLLSYNKKIGQCMQKKVWNVRSMVRFFLNDFNEPIN
ncbi:MAG: hypothetical protein LWW97_09665, partial [Deltaproteobacteria bacterium]|nr:hypothetical protein [Deltaproteobacteria bacterium]